LRVGLVGEPFLESGLHGGSLRSSLRWMLHWYHFIDEAYDSERASRVLRREEREENNEGRSQSSLLGDVRLTVTYTGDILMTVSCDIIYPISKVPA
jgi:hypothetical protein